MRCDACAHHCLLEEGHFGICGQRRVFQGKLEFPYGKISSLALDPMEKKPFFHALPGQKVLSFGTVGCNLHCPFCQNWEISQYGKDPKAHAELIPNVTPEALIRVAAESQAVAMASTYNEPLVALEWTRDVLHEAGHAGLFPCIVTNGHASAEAVEKLIPYVKAANIDLKCFREEGYRWLGGHLEPVLETIRAMAAAGVWLELTTLVVPGFNDSDEELRQIAEFIAGLSVDIPWHVSAYYHAYKMPPMPSRTDPERLAAAVLIGEETGLHFVYTGNLTGALCREHTDCPNCGTRLVSRHGFAVAENRLEKGICPQCGTAVAGRWNH